MTSTVGNEPKPELLNHTAFALSQILEEICNLVAQLLTFWSLSNLFIPLLMPLVPPHFS